MNEKLAIEILKQASLETTVGACEKCPRKDKNKTCIGCLDNAKCILLNYTDNLQSKIDKAIEFVESMEYCGQEDYFYDKKSKDPCGNDNTFNDSKNKLLDILKGSDKECQN